MYQLVLGSVPDASGLEYFYNRFGDTVESDELDIFKGMTTEEQTANAARDAAIKAKRGYAQGGAIRHYQVGGDVMSSMAEAEQLIKALEGGKLTGYEREEALSKIAEIYRKISEKPYQPATMSMYSAPQFQRNQRAILNQPTYSTPTASPVLQTAATTTPYVLPVDNSGRGNDGLSSNPGWDAMSNADKAAFYSANPTFSAITQAGLNILGLTSLGALQKALVPDFVREQQAIAKGSEAYSGHRNFGKESTIPIEGVVSPGVTARDAAAAAQAMRDANSATIAGFVGDPRSMDSGSARGGGGDGGGGARAGGGATGGGYQAKGGYIGSYAQGGAVRHYQAGGDVMSKMAEAEQLIKALEGGKLTEYERDDAMSRVAEIYRLLDEEPIQDVTAKMPPSMGLIEPMPESVPLTPAQIKQAIINASPLTALKEVVAKPPQATESTPLVRPLDPRLFGESNEVSTGQGYSPMDPRLFGESDEVATGPGYSPPVAARATPPAVDRKLLDLAAKYTTPGFTPTFATGSIDPGADRMALISQNSIPTVNIQPEYADDSASRLSMAKPDDTTIPMSPNMAMLQKMLLANQSQASPYANELRAARTAATAQTAAFNKMLENAIKGQDDNKPSNAEMYFRLAAAFGAPTKTGNFFESLAEVNKSLADQAKETRLAGKAGQALRLQLGLEGAKAGMTAAKEDVAALRALTSEEMKEKAAYGRELIKEYFRSGEAQSAAGKQAQDEGLIPGTPKYQARVTAISDEQFKRLTASVDASAAAAQASLAAISRGDEATKLAREKFDAAQAKTRADATKLSPPELKLKTETEDLVASTEQALKNLQRAYALNPNTFDTSAIDTAQRKILEVAGSKDPKVLATRELENLLSKGAIEKLRASFGGNPTEGERKILLSLEGLESKSIEERKLIMLNAYDALKITQARHKARLKDIVSGVYRTTTPEIAQETE